MLAREHLAVERVREPDVPPSAGGLDRDQPARLRLGQRVVAAERVDLGQPQRLAEREQLERAPLVLGEPGHPARDELGQRGAQRRRAGAAARARGARDSAPLSTAPSSSSRT